MAAIEQTLPAKSPTMTEGTIVAWRVKPGDKVKAGDVIAEIQTDKAVVEWDCMEGGFVREILIGAGQMAYVNQVAAIFSTKADDDVKIAIELAAKTNAKLASEAGGGAPAPVAAPLPVAPAPGVAPVPAPAPIAEVKPAAPAKAKRVTPVAARFAAEHRLDLAKVTGTGPDGRVVLRDVEAALKSGTAAIGTVVAGAVAAKPEKPKLKVLRGDTTPVTDHPVTPMRAIIAKRLGESKQQIPHFYVTESIDASALVALREQTQLLDGVKVTVNDLIVRACALALRVHPKVNATWHGNVIRHYDSADISVAVSIPDGLITPIVAKAHTKSVRQIGDEVRALAKKAVEGKLQPHEFQGGSFTISNLGMYGISEFMAIVNPPQVAILAVAGIKDEPVVRAGQLVAGKVMRVTLSADHRAVDGADAAAFLQTLRQLLENPASLLV